MPLPAISSNSQERNSFINDLKMNKDSSFTKTQPSSVRQFTQVGGLRSASKAAEQRQRNQEANTKAIEKSRIEINPLVPLITSISHTLTGMEKLLKDILISSKDLAQSLRDGMNGTGLGFGDIGDIGGGGKGRRGRNGGRSRLPKSKIGRGALGAVLGLGAGYGLSKMFGMDDEESTKIEAGGAVLGGLGGAISAGTTGAAEAGSATRTDGYLKLVVH